MNLIFYYYIHSGEELCSLPGRCNRIAGSKLCPCVKLWHWPEHGHGTVYEL